MKISNKRILGQISAVRSRIIIPLLISALTVLGGSSCSWAGCHCFRERSFDPSRPGAVDMYAMATARNSLLAAVSNTSKGDVVKRRMSGASEADLWLSLYLETAWGREDKNSALSVEAGKDNNRDQMAALLADGALARVFNSDPESLRELRSAGADTSEVTLSLLVSARTKPSPMEVFLKVRSGKTTWGKTLDDIGIPLDTVGDLVARQVKRAKESSSEF